MPKPRQPELSQILAALGQKQDGKYQCPVCNLNHLVVTEKAGTILMDCKTPNCPKGAAWKKITELLATPTNGATGAPPAIVAQWPGLTLAEFLKQKGLTRYASSLQLFYGLKETTYSGKETGGKKVPVVAFPYGTEINGKWVHTGTKIRGGSSHQTKWTKGEHEKTILQPYGLCRQGWENCADVLLCEGESDVLTLETYGLPTLGAPGAATWKPEFNQLAPIRNAERIFILKEPDAGGDEFVKKVKESGIPVEKLYVVTLPADAPDANALHLKYLQPAKPPANPAPFPWWKSDILTDDEEKLRRKEEAGLLGVDQAPFLEAFYELINKAKPQAGRYTLRSMADVQMKAIEWLWPGRVPRGKITIFGGQPGSGKSMVSCSLAAIASQGGPWPDSENTNKPMDVLMLYSEDEAEDTVVPRLEAAGANRHKVFDMKITAPKDGGEEERQIAFDRDRTLLEKMLRENPSIKLVIVDPVTSFMGDININKEQDVRNVLVPLKELASRTGVTFILIAHFNKRSDVTALNKILGAVAMTGVCRAVWLFTADESEDAEEGQYLMLYGKVNVARKAEGLEYTIEEKQILPAPADKSPYIVWGEKTTVSATQMLGLFGAAEKPSRANKLDRAKTWLAETLSAGKMLQSDIIEAAEKEGIKERTLYNAKKELEAPAQKEGKVWYWYPPK